MSGPGGPATPSATMTPPSNVGVAQNMARVRSNIQSMIDQGAPEADIDAYLGHEGVTVQDLQTSPVAPPGSGTEMKAYNPTVGQQMKDMVVARRNGVRPPQLPENAPVYQKAMDWMNGLGGASDTAARGATLGLYDEASGLGSGAAAAMTGKPFVPAFKQGMDATNQNIANFHEDNPTSAAALEVMGLLASPASRLGAEWQQAGPTVLNRAGRAAAVGAGMGAETGAAYNQGGVGDRLGAALWGAGSGGALGGAAAPVIEGTVGTGQTFMDAYRARQAAAADPTEHARQMLALAVTRDGMTPLPSEGEALVSAGGPNVQALGRQATVAPGSARAVASDYFQGAAADAPDVIGQSVQQNVSGNRLMPTLEALDRQQRLASGPAYDAFYGLSPDAFDTPYFRNLMGGQTGRGLIRGAYDLAELQRAAGQIPDNPMQQMLDAEGNVTLNQAPSPQAVDMMKQAIDQQVESHTDPVTGRIVGPMGHGWDRLRRSFVTAADQASTVNGTSLYQTARQAYGGPAQLKNAARMGSQALTGNTLTSEKAQAFNDLSPAQQDAFRTGLAEALIEKAGKMGPSTDPVNLFLKGRNANNLMQLYLGDQTSFDRFVQTLQQQSRIVKASKAVMGGSQTTPRLAENADAAAQQETLTDQLTMARDAWALATGRGGGRLNAAMNIYKRGQNAVTGVSEPVADELGRLLFNPSEAGNRATVQGLQAQARQAQLRQTARNTLRLRAGSGGMLPAAPAGAFIGSH